MDRGITSKCVYNVSMEQTTPVQEKVEEEYDEETALPPSAEGKYANTAEMVKFAGEFYRGLDGYIYLMFRDPKNKDKDSPIIIHKYETPEKLNSHFIRGNAQKMSIEYSIGTVKDNKPETTNKIENMVATQMVWADIDVLKTLDNSRRNPETGAADPNSPYPTGRQFYNFVMMDAEYGASAMVRSSEHGMQFLWKLDKPFVYKGDKAKFSKDIQPVLYKTGYYFGGDFKVCKAHMPMRLPGSLNLKNHAEHVVTVRYPAVQAGESKTVPTYPLKDLASKFDVTPEHCPLVFFFTIAKLIEKASAMGGGNRHEFMIQLCGTLRKGCETDCVPAKENAVGGLNEDTCRALILRVMDYFGDTDERDRMAIVDSTYTVPVGGALKTLKASDDESWVELHYNLMRVLHEWVKLQREFTKYLGLTFKAEWLNPERERALDSEDEVESGCFSTLISSKETKTTFLGDGDDQEPSVFGNFVVKIKANIVKSETGAKVWLADLFVDGEPITHPTEIEIGAADHDSATSFKKIIGMPAGLAVNEKKNWDKYIAFLASNAHDKPRMVETPYYGFLDVDKDKPTLLLPTRAHTHYLWSGMSEDTAEKEVFLRQLDDAQKIQYLTDFKKNYFGYHEERYATTALGWIAACSISEWIHTIMGGFPTLAITGLAGSGKSQLMKILGKHYGAKTSKSFASTTMFSMKRHLTSNNVCPLILDEFRLSDIRKTKDVQDIIRSLWDKSQTSAGRSDRTVVTEQYAAPLCVMGEHHYTDEAALHRTVSIKIDRTWVKKIGKSSPEVRAQNQERHDWLDSHKRSGLLGAILIQWVESHADEVAAIVNWAEDKMIPEYRGRGLTIERKAIGYAGVLAGLKLLSVIFKDFGLSFPLGHQAMMDHIFSADKDLSDQESHDNTALRALFRATDRAITIAGGHKVPYKNVWIAFDSANPDMAYFVMSRWFDEVQLMMKEDASATLTNFSAFQNLLEDSAANEDSPIKGIYKTHPLFEEGCMKVNIRQIGKKFSLNVNQWDRAEELAGEY